MNPWLQCPLFAYQSRPWLTNLSDPSIKTHCFTKEGSIICCWINKKLSLMHKEERTTLMRRLLMLQHELDMWSREDEPVVVIRWIRFWFVRDRGWLMMNDCGKDQEKLRVPRLGFKVCDSDSRFEEWGFLFWFFVRGLKGHILGFCSESPGCSGRNMSKARVHVRECSCERWSELYKGFLISDEYKVALRDWGFA